MAAKKKAGSSKSKGAGKASTKLKDLSPKGDKKIKGGKNPRGLINFA